MQWTEIQKDWKVVSRQFRTKWSKLTDADLTAVAGKREELIKRLVKLYGTSKGSLELEVDAFVKTLKTAKA